MSKKNREEATKVSPEQQIANLKVAAIKTRYRYTIALVALAGVVFGAVFGYFAAIGVITDSQSRASEVITSAVLKERQ